MSLQRQHFLLSYLKTRSVGPAVMSASDLPHDALPTEPTSRLYDPCLASGAHTKNIDLNFQSITILWGNEK